MKLIEKFTSESYYENQLEHEILETSSNIKITHYSGQDTYKLYDLTDAMKKGKTVTTFSINKNWGEKDCLCNIFYQFDFDLSKLFNFCLNLQWEKSEWGGWKEIEMQILGINLKIYRDERKAIHIFNPLNLSEFKPLKEVPKKMTLTHTLRALINGQYSDLKCNGIYTDDYAFDAACNYQSGEIKNGVAFARRILESHSGWWTHLDENMEVSICCHSFDSNEFKLVI